MFEISSTETQVWIKASNGGFDVDRLGVKRNAKMNVDQAVLEFQDGRLVEISLKGKAYKNDGTVGNALASQDVWPDLDSEPEADAEYFLSWTSLPVGLLSLVKEQIARHTTVPA